MSVFQLVLGISALGNLAIGLYVLWKNPRKFTHNTFFFFTLGVSLFTGGFMLLVITEDFFFDKFIHYGALMAILGFYFFSLTFPENGRPQLHWILLSIPIFLTGVFIVPFNYIVSYIRFDPQTGLIPTQGPFIVPYALGLFMYVIISIGLLFKKYYTSNGKARLQIQYIFLGTGIFMIVVVISNAVLPALGYTNYIFLGPLVSIIVSTLSAYAIVRHQLLDIKVVIQRGLIFTILLAGIIGFYLATIYTFALIFHQFFTVFSAGVTTLVGIFSVPYIERILRRKTDKFFFKDRYDYSEALYSLSKTVNAKLFLEDIIVQTESTLKSLLKTDEVRVTVVNDGSPSDYDLNPLDTHELKTLTIPIVFEKKVIGKIFLGNKLSGDKYTSEDISLLRTFSNQAALAFEKARLYKEVRDYSLELEDRVNERTKHIQNLQEDQKQMMLDIAHELQNPLTLIKGEVSVLMKQIPDDRNVSLFSRSIDEVSEFIYDLLHLARLDAGEAKIDQIPIDFSMFLNELVEDYKVITNAEEILLESHIEPNIWIQGDHDKLKELIANLVSNAIKYMGRKTPQAKREISITLRKDGSQYILTIRDTGIGISQKNLPNLFDRFYRIHNDHDKLVKGTGLGLTICKKIVTIHGGKITVESTLGKGTTFTVTLPSIKEVPTHYARSYTTN